MVRGPDRAVKRAEVLAQMEPGTPETAPTLSEHFQVHPDTVYDRLAELYEIDQIATKQPDSRSRVWWIPDPDTDINPDVIEAEMFRSAKDPEILRSLARAKRRGEPMTSKEIAAEIDEKQDITYQRLRKLDNRGHIESLKAGSTSKVWWIDSLESALKSIEA